MAKAKLGWGIIGATGWGDHTFAPAVTGASNAALNAVLSSRATHARAFCKRHGAANGYTDLTAFLADDGVDAVWIASPNHLHAEQAIAALKAGKHVLCEKPMAVTSADCRAMMRAASRAKRLLSVGYNTRHHPRCQALRADWVAGKFGKPVHGRVHFYYAYPELPAKWRRRRETSGSWVMGDVATHAVDLLRWFLGDAAEVNAHLTRRSWRIQNDDHALIMLRFKNGAVGSVSASTGAPSPNSRIELYGTEGYVIFDGVVLGFPGSLTVGYRNGRKRTVPLAAVKTYQRQVESFGRAVAGKGEFPVSARDGLANLEILEAARGW